MCERAGLEIIEMSTSPQVFCKPRPLLLWLCYVSKAIPFNILPPTLETSPIKFNSEPFIVKFSQAWAQGPLYEGNMWWSPGSRPFARSLRLLRLIRLGSEDTKMSLNAVWGWSVGVWWPGLVCECLWPGEQLPWSLGGKEGLVTLADGVASGSGKAGPGSHGPRQSLAVATDCQPGQAPALPSPAPHNTTHIIDANQQHRGRDVELAGFTNAVHHFSYQNLNCLELLQWESLCCWPIIAGVGLRQTYERRISVEWVLILLQTITSEAERLGPGDRRGLGLCTLDMRYSPGSSHNTGKQSIHPSTE